MRSPDAVAYFDDFDAWRNAVILDLGAEVQTQLNTPEEVADADEVTSPPAGNINLGSRLTFAGVNTGLDLDFYLQLKQPGATVTFNGNEMEGAYHPELSIGDVDNHDNDDFEIQTTGASPGCTVYAMGAFVGDNELQSGEFLRVYGEGDLLLDEITSRLPNCSCYRFMGVVSPVPITRIYFNESNSGGDDICIQTFHFGVSCD